MFRNRKISYFLIAMMMCGGGSATQTSVTQDITKQVAGIGFVATGIPLLGIGSLAAFFGSFPTETFPRMVANLCGVKISDESSAGLAATGHPDKAAILTTASKGMSIKEFEILLACIIGGIFGGSLGFLFAGAKLLEVL